MDFSRKEALKHILISEALKTGDFVLSSGKRSHYYVDCRKITLSTIGARMIGKSVRTFLKTAYPNVTAIGGLTLGADPIVGATLASSADDWNNSLKGFLVRRTRKYYGTEGQVEGPLLLPEDQVLIVDDVATTGLSSLQAVDAAERLGCKVVGVLVILDRLEGAREMFEKHNIPFHSFLTIRDLGVEPLHG